jgi:hypothetical protein
MHGEIQTPFGYREYRTLKRAIQTGLLLCVLGCGPVLAEGVAVNPGLWEMTMTMQMPMLAAPQERTYTDCVKETELNPEKFQMEQDSGCSVDDVNLDGDTISWSMACDGPMGPTTGQWSFTSDGDNVHGNGNMTANISGQPMEFTMTWTGSRLGDCEEETAQ